MPVIVYLSISTSTVRTCPLIRSLSYFIDKAVACFDWFIICVYEIIRSYAQTVQYCVKIHLALLILYVQIQYKRGPFLISNPIKSLK